LKLGAFFPKIVVIVFKFLLVSAANLHHFIRYVFKILFILI
jgi:hypothetical protein